MSEINYGNVMEQWVGKYPEVTRWLNALQKKRFNAFMLYRFCRWASKTPTELLALKDDPRSKAAEILLDTFVAGETAEFTNSVKVTMATAVKSFFRHNYSDLAKASGAIALEKVRPTSKPSKEALRKLWSWALNPRDKALITFVNSTGVAKETLINLLWSHFEANWEQQEVPCVNVPGELLKGHNRGKYKGVRQITFLTPEAKRDLLTYKEWIEQKLGRTMTPEDNVWFSVEAPFKPLKYVALGKLAWQLSKNTGVKFSLHDARRYVNTALEEINISPNWARKIRGRKVRGEESPYSQPAIEQLREKFKQAVPLLEFTTTRKAEIPQEVRDELAQLAARQEELKRKYDIYMRKGGSKPEDVGIEPEPEEPTETDEPCEDGEHCGETSEPEFKEIPETELLNHLKAGWRIVKEMQNGAVIVQRGGN